MNQPFVEFKDGYVLISIPSDPWGADASVRMTKPEFRAWLFAMLQELDKWEK